MNVEAALAVEPVGSGLQGQQIENGIDVTVERVVALARKRPVAVRQCRDRRTRVIIEGIGIGFIPPHWRPDEVDEVLSATTEEAIRMCRRLAREEGIFAGTSSGLNVIAALRVAERLGPDATVATIMIDTGLRYVSTDVYRVDQ